MLIYAVADIHGKKSHLTTIRENIDKYNPDLLVVAGDLARRFRYRNILKELNNLKIPVASILGNTDWKFIHRIMDRESNLINLNLNNYTNKEFSFVGISGTITLPFKNIVCFNEKKRFDKISEFMSKDTILVAHPPPYGILDMVFRKYHSGSRYLKKFIEEHQPQLVLCGHIHEQTGRAFIEQTLVVNCAMTKHSKGAMIKLGKDHMPKVELVKSKGVKLLEGKL
ncbi:MAG: phosphoesterase [Desulfobacterales bacterium]|nr:phosphoesterase [Desulfobacterales bacterium]